MTLPRAIVVILVALACAHTPSMPEARPPAVVATPVPSRPEGPLDRRLAATPSTAAFAELLTWFEAQPPGPARDQALAETDTALAAWPDRSREAPDAWGFDLIAGRVHVAWPLVRRIKASFIDPENALKLLREPGLAIITDLDLRADGSKDEQAAVALALQASPQLAKVTSLGLSLAGGPALARMVTQPRSRPLRHLRLLTDLGADGVAILATAPALAELERLDLSFIALSRADLEVLTKSPPLRGLRSLALAGADLDDADLAVLVGGFPALRELDLGRNKFGLAGLGALTSAAFFANLELLDLDDIELGDAGAQLLAPRLGAGLRELRLAGNPLGPDGTAAIAEAHQLEKLEVLDLSPPVSTHNVGRKGALALAGATHLRRLREVAFHAWDDGRMGRDVFLALAAAPWLAIHEEHAEWVARAALYDLTLSPADAAAAVPADAAFTVRRTGSHAGDLAVTIFADGRVEATHGPVMRRPDRLRSDHRDLDPVRIRLAEPRPGSTRRDQVDITVVRVLLADARRIGLPNLRSDECSQARMIGNYWTLEVSLGGASQSVDIWNSCFKPETIAALDRLGERIEALSGALAWINDEWLRTPRWAN